MADTDNKFLDYDGLELATEVYLGIFAGKDEVPTKTSDLTNDSNFPTDADYVHTDNNLTDALKAKLEGIATGAEVNQNAFGSIVVGASTIEADAKTDALTLAAGSNVTITADASTDTVTIAAADTTYSAVVSGSDTPGLMTGADKAKLDGVAAGAQVNVIEDIKVGGTSQAVTGKSVSLGTAAGAAVETVGVASNTTTLPTTAQVKSFVEGKGYATTQDVSDAIENAGHTTISEVQALGYQTQDDVEGIVEGYGYATETYVASAVAGASHLKKEVVATLPAIADADPDTIYLVPNSGSAPNVKDEYMVINGAFELLGTTATDLTGYATETYVNTAVTGMATQTWVGQQGFALAADVPQPMSDAQIRAAIAAALAV